MFRRYARATTLALTTLVMFAALALAGCSGAKTDKTGLALAEEVCSQCHSMARFYLLEGEKNWNWSFNVPRMVKTHKAGLDGRTLSEEQQKSIIDALENRVQTPGEVAVRAQCTTCHTLDRVIERYHITNWKEMIEMMDVHYGATFTPEDKVAMEEFLSATK